MAIYKIRKRNWAVVSFDREKIEKAIKLAIQATNSEDFSKISYMTDKILTLIESKVENTIPDIETIQDCVETVLIKEGLDQVAKAYITYRATRKQTRSGENVVVEVQKTIAEYLDQSDWRVNANSNQGYSLWWMILNTAGKVSANYRLSCVYPEEIGSAHRNWDMHIHDLDMLSAYCAGWSLRQLLEEGFNGLNNRVQSAPPRNLQSAVNQMINFFWTLQNEWAGAQAFSSFDTFLAPFVHKQKESIIKELEEAKSQLEWEERAREVDKRLRKYVKQQFQNFIFGLNVPSRWGTQTPFTNITLDWTCPNDLKEKALFLWGIDNGPYKVKYGDLQDEMRLINEILIDVYTEWDRKGAVFTFPIPTYNITEDFPWKDPLIDKLFEMTAKYWIPYFQNFIGSQFEKDEKGRITTNRKAWAYSPDAVRSMCCRLQLDLKQLEKRWGGLFGSSEMTWSIWVVTLNLWRIGYNFKWDLEGYKKQIKKLCDLAKTSLEIKRKEVTKWLESWLYPYTKRYLHSFRNHFSTIGINGMNESMLNFTNGKDDLTTVEWRKLAIEIMDYIRELLTQYQEETGSLYNLEATPAEGTTYRFAKEDKKQLPDIIQAGTDEAPYYTNSTQLPVDFTDDIFEAMDLQDELQCKYTWWTVLHLYTGERMSSASCKNLVKKAISNYQLPYISISPTFSICPKHWYIAGEHDYCPLCDKEIGYTGEKYNVELRKHHTANKDKLDEIEKERMN